MLLLFYPWYQEDKINIESETYEEAFSEIAQAVMEKRHEYEYNIQDTEVLDQLEEQIASEVDEEMWDDVAPMTEKENKQILKYREKLPQTTTLGQI